jgi:hypothetical protein
MQVGQRGSVVQHKSLESRAQGELANAVRGGADGCAKKRDDRKATLLGGGAVPLPLSGVR